MTENGEQPQLQLFKELPPGGEVKEPDKNPSWVTEDDDDPDRLEGDLYK
jgi:hypothetical protein